MSKSTVMELNKIEMFRKIFEGQTSIHEEMYYPRCGASFGTVHPIFFKGCYTGVETRNSVDDS
jgi:hypothetical protein